MTAKIALEEHFLAPECEDYWLAAVRHMPDDTRKSMRAQLLDFDELRLGAMDEAGIERAVLSLTVPGVQVEPNTAAAIHRACSVNDFLARQVQRYPKRYSGFAHLPMQDPVAAADELERCVRQLGFVGTMIHGHTLGHYLDEEPFYPFWERVQELGVPVYLHPADSEVQYAAWRGYQELRHATWEWTVETATHTLRLVFGGIFERFPRVRFVLGHMGETLPFLLWRLDSRARLYGYRRDKLPSEYLRTNVLVTTSGAFSNEPLACALSALGEDSVMFSLDYPYESPAVARDFIETAPVADDLRRKICFGTAARLLRV
jgi:2,3-dihydroxybenzoate decarboxylase